MFGFYLKKRMLTLLVWNIYFCFKSIQWNKHNEISIKKKTSEILLLITLISLHYIVFFQETEMQTGLITLLSFTQRIYIKVNITFDTVWLYFRSQSSFFCKAFTRT